MKYAIPAANKAHAMLGNMVRLRLLRPKVSMVKTAGLASVMVIDCLGTYQVKTKFNTPLISLIQDLDGLLTETQRRI
jgi:hypothetical protein